MGNKGSRSRAVQPVDIRSIRNPILKNQILTNIIEVKPHEIIEKPDNSKCPSCGKTGKDFTVVSRDGTTYTKMYYCRTCSQNWKD